VQAAGLGERVHFLGEVDDAQLPACYHAADAFVLPSHLRSEAFGIVQLEAQSAGLPIVCTELGTGTSHVTQHGVTGLVVPPANPPALARALDLLLANPALARCMGASARARVVREFSHARMLERMEAVYSEVWRTRQ
jgi:rhamnosyl/mannosyltransferase